MILRRSTNTGLIKTIIVLFVILLILAYLGLNLRTIVASPTFQDNWNYISGIAVNLWNNYLSGFLSWVWNSVVLPLINKSASQMQQTATTTSTVI